MSGTRGPLTASWGLTRDVLGLLRRHPNDEYTSYQVREMVGLGLFHRSLVSRALGVLRREGLIVRSGNPHNCPTYRFTSNPERSFT